MDIRCPKCSEPWDIDTLHDEAGAKVAEEAERLGDDLRRPYAEVFAAVRRDFNRRGCEALGTSHNDTTASPLVAEVLDLLGDDIDGAASLLEDAEALGFDLYA